VNHTETETPALWGRSEKALRLADFAAQAKRSGCCQTAGESHQKRRAASVGQCFGVRGESTIAFNGGCFGGCGRVTDSTCITSRATGAALETSGRATLKTGRRATMPGGGPLIPGGMPPGTEPLCAKPACANPTNSALDAPNTVTRLACRFIVSS
jgi:hypothetical protein